MGVIPVTVIAHDLADAPDPGRVWWQRPAPCDSQPGILHLRRRLPCQRGIKDPKPPLGDPVIRSHRRDEPGRRLAFRILTAVILSGSGLSIALITAGGRDDPHQIPVRTSDEVSRALPRAPVDPTTDPPVPTITDP